MCQGAIGHPLWMHDHQLNLKEVPSISHQTPEAQMLVGRRVLPPVSEKARGKRAAADEPAPKRRKMAGSASIKPGGISLGDDQTS